MTTNTFESSGGGGFTLGKAFLVFLTIILAFIGASMLLALQPMEIHTTQPVNAPGGYAHPLPEIQITKHSWQKHDMDALAAELCGASYGIKQVRWQKQNNVFHLLCVTAEGEVFVQIIEKIREMFYKQKTAFRYINQKTGNPMTWAEVQKYLDGFTQRWTGHLP